jgi:hypothetical protein
MMDEASPDFETRGVRGSPYEKCGANPSLVRVDVKRIPDVKPAEWSAEAIYMGCQFWMLNRIARSSQHTFKPHCVYTVQHFHLANCVSASKYSRLNPRLASRTAHRCCNCRAVSSKDRVVGPRRRTNAPRSLVANGLIPPFCFPHGAKVPGNSWPSLSVVPGRINNMQVPMQTTCRPFFSASLSLDPSPLSHVARILSCFI